MLISREPAPIRQQTVASLRTAICEGRFKPGDRLIERELCELIGVSRTSVREALRQLEAEGLIAVIPNKGPVVASMTEEEARGIYQVREVMESLACRLFAEQANPEQVEALTAVARQFEVASRGGDAKELVKAKSDFYAILLEGCGNKLVQSFLSSLHARISILRSTSMSLPGRPPESSKEINFIVEAIQRRDPDSAWERSVIHLRNSQSVAMRALSGMRVAEVAQ